MNNINLNYLELKENKLSFDNLCKYYNINYICNNRLIDYAYNSTFDIEVIKTVEIDKDYYINQLDYFFDFVYYAIIDSNDIDILTKYVDYPIAYIYDLNIYIIPLDSIGVDMQLTSKKIPKDLIKC